MEQQEARDVVLEQAVESMASFRARQRAGRRVALFASLAVLLVFVSEVLAAYVTVFLDIPEDSLVSAIVMEFTGAAAAVAGVWLLGGRRLLEVSPSDIGYTFRFGWWCLATSVLLIAFDVVLYAFDGTAVASDWALLLVELTFFCLGVGVAEEFLFRGLIFNGLLAVCGSTDRGVKLAIALTSIAFGFAHVDFAHDFGTPLMAVQALLKATQTGIYSVMLCTIFLRTRRLGGVSLFHGIDDLMLMVPSVAIYGEPFDTEYVMADDEALPTIGLYVVVIALYLPLLVKSLRELHSGDLVWLGGFMDEALYGRGSTRVEPVYALVPAGQEGQDLSWEQVPPFVERELPVPPGWEQPHSGGRPPAPTGLS